MEQDKQKGLVYTYYIILDVLINFKLETWHNATANQ